jgi:single-strand DNA-binding protein
LVFYLPYRIYFSIFDSSTLKKKSMSINKVILVGNVGKDPEVRNLEGGATVARFTMATSETYKNKNGEKVTTTEWHNIVLWRGLAEIAEKYVKKGQQLYLEGRIRSRTYEDKDGVQKRAYEIQGDNMQMLGGKRQDDSSSSSADTPTKISLPEDIAPAAPAGDDDLPF